MRMGPLSRLLNAALGWPRNRIGTGFTALPDAQVRMFVMQHAPCDLPACFADRAIYSPIQCGAALHAAIAGCLSDAAGENCSTLNADINEMTAIWWVGRHYAELGNPDYVGFNHYRRFLAGSSAWLASDTVLACRWLSWRSNRAMFAAFHRAEDLDIILRQLAAAGVLEQAEAERYFDGHVFYPVNMFAADRATFLRYFAFIDDCVRVISHMIQENAIDRSAYAPYQRRVYGFVFERLTSFWIWREKRRGAIRVIGCDVQDVGR